MLSWWHCLKSWQRIVYQWGEPAPGPCELRLPPTPEVVAAKTYVDLHRFNVERRRADAILLAARRANRLEEAATMATADALRLQVYLFFEAVQVCPGGARLARDYLVARAVIADVAAKRHMNVE